MNRITHIDIAKGISITLVALFHSHVKIFIPQIVESMSLFRIPLFFFLSGVFFYSSVQSKHFLAKKLENLLKPYFFVLFILFLIDAFILNKEQLLIQFLGIFYGTGETIRWIPMWFLPHLFAVHCFAYFLFRYCHFERYSILLQSLCLATLLFSGIFFMKLLWHVEISTSQGIAIKLPGLPFSIDIIFVTITFFLLGYILRSQVIHFTQRTSLLLISLILFFIIISFTNSYTNLNVRAYNNPLFASLGAICGIYIVLYLSRFIEKYSLLKRVFIAFGRGSLFILIFHGFINNKAYIVISSLFWDNHSFLLAFFVFIISITLPLLIKWVVEKSNILSLFFFPLKGNKLLKRKYLAS